MAQKYVPVPLRRLVRARAGERCEYCLSPEHLAFRVHWVDHIVAEKHGGQTEEGNMALTCALCNQRKGTDLTSIDPETGQITPLFHPRRDRWAAGAKAPAAAGLSATSSTPQYRHPSRQRARP
jgi:5-methylcytosine-specific restriction endonuclease McrA